MPIKKNAILNNLQCHNREFWYKIAKTAWKIVQYSSLFPVDQDILALKRFIWQKSAFFVDLR